MSVTDEMGSLVVLVTAVVTFILVLILVGVFMYWHDSRAVRWSVAFHLALALWTGSWRTFAYTLVVALLGKLGERTVVA